MKWYLQQQLAFYVIIYFYFSCASTSSEFSKTRYFPCTSLEKLTEVQTMVQLFFPATDKYIDEFPTLASFKNRVLLPPFDFHWRHITTFENKENLAFDCCKKSTVVEFCSHHQYPLDHIVGVMLSFAYLFLSRAHWSFLMESSIVLNLFCFLNLDCTRTHTHARTVLVYIDLRMKTRTHVITKSVKKPKIRGCDRTLL